VFEGNMPVGLETGTEHKSYQLNEAVIFLVTKSEHTGSSSNGSDQYSQGTWFDPGPKHPTTLNTILRGFPQILKTEVTEFI
jgi:hypothetical protein